MRIYCPEARFRKRGGGEAEQSKTKKGREKEGRRKHADVRRVQTAAERVHGNGETQKRLPISGSPLFCPVCVLLRKRSLPFLAPGPEGIPPPAACGGTLQRMEAASRFQP